MEIEFSKRVENFLHVNPYWTWKKIQKNCFFLHVKIFLKISK